MRIPRLLAICALSAPALLFAQTEGVATFRITMKSADRPGPHGTSRISFSRSAVRVDSKMDFSSAGGDRTDRSKAPTSMGMTMIQKLSEPDKVYLINDESKSYSILDVSKNRSDARTDETWTVKRQGRGSVAGVSCDNALITSSKGTEVEACVTPELFGSAAWWSAMNRRGGSDTWIKAMNDSGLKGLPVRMKMRTAQGKEGGVEMELVSFEHHSVPGSQFEVPAGYKLMSSGLGAMSPEQQKRMNDALSKMTPEQRKAYEDAMKRTQESRQ